MKGGANRILHIDSPPPFLRFVEKYCQSKALEVDSTDLESVGFLFALVKPYRLILIGAHAPRVDAFRIIKGLVRARIATPVFLVSESASRDAKWMGQFPNLVGILSKPLDLGEFSRCLADADKPPELDHEERRKILSVLGRWEKGFKNES